MNGKINSEPSQEDSDSHLKFFPHLFALIHVLL